MRQKKAAITVFGNKSWSDGDLARLALGYKYGFSIRLISTIVDRSLTATNKALTRHGLRNQFGLRRSSFSKPVNVIPEFLARELNALKITASPSSSSGLRGRNITTSKISTIVPKRRVSIVSNIDCTLTDHKLAPRIKAEDIYQQVKLPIIIKELRSNGMRIVELFCLHHTRQGYNYLLNNKPVTCSGLLLYLNNLRRQQQLPIYFLEDVTDR